MDPRRLRAGEWVTVASGLALLVSLFLPWYGEASGFEALSVIDVVLAAIAISAVLLGVVTAQQRVPAVPLAVSALVELAGVLGLLLVLLRVVDLPGGADERAWGLWVALVAAAGVVGGAAIAMRDESWPGAPRRDIETMPAPRP